MSDWWEREERERRDDWMAMLNVSECSTCGALYFEGQYGEASRHDEWHTDEDAERA